MLILNIKFLYNIIKYGFHLNALVEKGRQFAIGSKVVLDGSEVRNIC